MAPKRSGSFNGESDSGRKLRRQSTEQKAEKAIKDNCKGFSMEQTHIIRNADGKTMFEAVCADLRRKRNDDNFKLGAKRWKDIKQQFCATQDNLAALELVDPPEEIPQEIFRAVVACKKQHPDRTLLQLALGTFGMPNRTTLVGLVVLARSMNPRVQKQLPCCLDICRWVVRENVRSKFPEQIKCLYAFFDTTMTTCFERGGLEPLHFLKLHEALCGLVLPEQPMKAAIACDGNWAKVEQELNYLVASSHLGTSLFSFCVLKMISRLVGDKIAKGCLELKDKAVTREEVNTLRVKILRDCEALDNISLLPAKRTIEVLYRQQTFAYQVTSLSQQVSLETAAAWKSMAVTEGSLTQVWAERLLFGTESDFVADAENPAKVDKELCAPTQTARCEINKIYCETEGGSGAACLQAMKPAFQRALSTDTEFMVEIMLVENVCGEGSDHRLTSVLLNTLPNGSKYVSVESALQNVTSIAHSPLFRLSSKPAQAKVHMCTKWLTHIMDGKALEFGEASRDKQYKKLVEAFGFLVKHEKAGGSGAPKITYGAAAIFEIFHDVKAKVGTEGCKLEQVLPLRVWGYLVPPALALEAQSLVKQVEQTTVSKVKVAAKTGKKASGDAAVAEAMALFTRKGAK